MSITEQDNIKILDTAETPDAIFEVLQYTELGGSADLRVAEKLFYANAAGMKLKCVRVRLKNSALRNEPGSLFYMRGQLEMRSSTGGGVTKALKRKFLSGETALVNEIHGTGDIILEPSMGHFLLVPLNNEEIIVDRSMFYAGSAGLDISSKMVSLTSAVAGGEGLFQTQIAGTGIAVLYSPVPRSEITEVMLDNESLQVDGSFAIMRSAGVKFTVGKASRSWLSTSTSGEGLLSKFTGTGKVLLAPTEEIYNLMATDHGLSILASPPGARNAADLKQK